jgi:hypothetical protein
MVISDWRLRIPDPVPTEGELVGLGDRFGFVTTTGFGAPTTLAGSALLLIYAEPIEKAGLGGGCKSAVEALGTLRLYLLWSIAGTGGVIAGLSLRLLALLVAGFTLTTAAFPRMTVCAGMGLTMALFR